MRIAPSRRCPGSSAAFLVVSIVMLMSCIASTAGAQGRRCDGATPVVEWRAISDGSGAATAPATDGSVVAWADDRHGNLDIYAADVKSGAESTVHAGPGDQTDPVVACGQVYWIDLTAAGRGVWSVDADTGQPVQIWSGKADQLAAGGSHLAWTVGSGADTDIVGYDIEESQAFIVCDAAGDQVAPAVSDDLIAWEDHRNGAQADIYASTPGGDEFPVTEARGDQVTPSVYGSLVLWADHRAGSWDIYGLNTDELQAGYSSGARMAFGRSCDQRNTEFVVCDAEGDQVEPVVSGPVAYWTDEAAGKGQADIAGVDLTEGDQFAATEAAGPQTAPAAASDGDYVVWLDGSGAKPVIAGGWLNRDGGGGEPGPVEKWTTDDVVTLFLSVLAEYGAFDEVRFAVDRGAYGDWQSLADTGSVKIPDHDGAHVIHIALANAQFEAGALGSEDQPLTIDVTTILDTKGPVTVAPKAAVSSRGSATLALRIKDRLSPTAATRVRIKDRRGRVVRVVDLGQVPTNKLVNLKMPVSLRRGHYSFRVTARDLAGNAQRKAGGNRLVVK